MMSTGGLIFLFPNRGVSCWLQLRRSEWQKPGRMYCNLAGKKYTADQICNMVDFLVDNFCEICSFFLGGGGGEGTASSYWNPYAPLLTYLFLYSCESELLDRLVRSGHRRHYRSFNLCYRYTDDFIVFNNKKFIDCVKDI